MQFLTSFFPVNHASLQGHYDEVLATAIEVKRWLSLFVVTYSIEFFCLSVAKLMVLDRMKKLLVSDAVGSLTRWDARARFVMAAAVVGNVVGLASNVAAAVFFKKSADSTAIAAALHAANHSAAVGVFINISTYQAQDATRAMSVEQFCEFLLLLLIIVAFAVVGVACARLFSSALRDMNDAAGAAGRKVRRQIVGTCAFVFVTFLLRVVYVTMFAVANLGQNQGACPEALGPCDDCYNDYHHMQQWLLYVRMSCSLCFL